MSDAAGDFLRACLASEMQRRTGALTEWKRQETKAGRGWWVPKRGKNQALWPTPLTGNVTAAAGGNNGGMALRAAAGRGILNARWVAQLMGFPADWCDFEEAAV